jgi:hypothetical protein
MPLTVALGIDLDIKKYLLLLPSGYGHNLRVSGPIGATPDVSLLGQGYEMGGDAPYVNFRRMKLPCFIKDLTFTLSKPLGSKYPVEVRDFYHMKDFFVVSTKIKDFILSQSGGEFEMEKIKVVHQDNMPIPYNYWAIKCISRYDCIDSIKSTAYEGPWNDRKITSFNQNITEIELSPELVSEFSNHGANMFRSYPQHGAENIVLNSNVVPDTVKLFEPSYFPGHLLIEPSFSKELAKISTAGSGKYNFWIHDLINLKKQYSETMQALR